MSEKLPVLLVQMGRPPVDIRNAVGDQSSWFEAALKHPALGHLPPAFPVFLSHEQSVLELPPGAVCLGASSHDANQIIRYTPSAISVQFHPEFTSTVMNQIIGSRSERAALKGKNKQVLLSEVSGTPEARAILQRFVLPSA